MLLLLVVGWGKEEEEEEGRVLESDFVVVVSLLGGWDGGQRVGRRTWIRSDEAAGFEFLDRDFGVGGEEEDVPV